MNRIFFTIICFCLLGITSCKVENDVTPDINTNFSRPFQIRIFSNNALTTSQLIDIITLDEYNSIKTNFERFELRRITYEIKNYNAPDDIFFSGDVICSNEEETESYVVGKINRTKLSGLADTGNEYEITADIQNIDKVLTWLESPGRLNIKSGYNLTDELNNPYKINGLNSGSNFELIINFYLKVIQK